MSFLDILVPVISVTEDEPALLAAETVASFAKGGVTALLLEVQPDPTYTYEAATIGTMWEEILNRAQSQFAEDKALLDKRAATHPMTTRELSILPGALERELAAEARRADLTVLVRPGGSFVEGMRQTMYEGALFGSGRPVLVVPPTWKPGQLGRNVVVAWNGKREAARALADAAPFLERADAVTVVTVGAVEPRDAITDVVAHLARRGIKAQARLIDDAGAGEADALMVEAAALNADLVVMGGYGRSRFREFVFGGVTREAITSAPLPILMSH